MKPIKAIKKLFRDQVRKAFDPLENIDLNKVVGWRRVGGSSAYGYYADNQYENGFSSISKLSNGFAQVEQYAIGKDAKPAPSNILDRTYTPNTDMSAYDFREALAVCFLVQDEVRLRVHHKGTRISPDSILGFTFMEDYITDIIDGSRRYRMANGEYLTDDEVITIKSVNPNNLTGGFSPSRAARRWTRLDDYIADYQRGFFENGAVPAGEMIITARTSTEFNDIVDTLQAKHRGASKSNNISYVHRPTDQNGNAQNAQVEWIPFSSPNKDMGLKEIFENVNKKIDSVYGVPAEIRGFLSNSNYASVVVAEKIFVKYALYPMTLKIWSKFTHEINRVTGGAGVAFTFKLEIPKIADEEKINAEAKQVIASTITTLTDAGYDLPSAISYAETGNPEVLKLGTKPPEDKPEIADSEDIKNSPDQPIDMYSKDFQILNLKVDKLIRDKETPKPVVKQLGDVDRTMYEFKVAKIINDQMQRQVDKAIARLDEAMKSKAFGDATEEEDRQFVEEMLVLILPLMAIYGNKQNSSALNMIVQAGLSTEDVTRFSMTPAQRKAYEKYLTKIGTGYNEYTAEQIRKVLGEGIIDGATKAEIEDRLRTIITGPENQYRVTRLSVTEINTAEAKASLSSMQNIKAETGYTIQKKKTHFGTDPPCEFCKTLLNEGWKDVDADYVPEGETLTGVDGGVYKNTWRDIDCGDIHANGHCGEEFRVKRS